MTKPGRPMWVRYIRRLRFGVVAAALVLAAQPLVDGALAYHDVYFGSSYGGTTCNDQITSQCVANDATHYFGLVDLSTARAGATQRALSTLYGPNSDINVSNANSSDLKVFEIDSMRDAYAWTQCASTGATFGGSDAAHTRWCQPQYIYWNIRSAVASKVVTTAQYNYIGCHEVGHTVGLRHRSGTPSTCLVSANPPSSSSPCPSIDYNASADYDRINLHY